MDLRKGALSFHSGHEPVVESGVGLRQLVEASRVDLSGEEVVGGSDGVDVTSQMQVELIHWNHL